MSGDLGAAASFTDETTVDDGPRLPRAVGLERPRVSRASAPAALEERQKELFGSAPGSVNLPRRIELLSFSRLSLGLKLMGVVRQVNAKSVVLSLPNSLTGHLDVRDISDFVHELPAKVVHQVDLRKLFKAGQ